MKHACMASIRLLCALAYSELSSAADLKILLEFESRTFLLRVPMTTIELKRASGVRKP